MSKPNVAKFCCVFVARAEAGQTDACSFCRAVAFIDTLIVFFFLLQVATPKNDCDSDDSSVSEPADSSVKSVAPQPTNQSTEAAVPPTTTKKGKGKRTTIEDQLSSFMTNISASSRSTFEVFIYMQ